MSQRTASPRRNQSTSNTTALSPTNSSAAPKPRRNLGCDLHLLGIKLASRRLLSHPKRVAKVLLTMDRRLGPEDLTVILQAFPDSGDSLILQKYHLQRALDLWHNVCKPREPPLSKTELFIWELAAVEHGPARAELLLNLEQIPGIIQTVRDQVHELGQACQYFLGAKHFPRLLRLVRLVCSVL